MSDSPGSYPVEALPPPPPEPLLALPPAGGTGGFDSTSPLARVLGLVDSVVDAGRSRTLGIERAASVARRFPAVFFGATLAIAGLTFLILAFLRGIVEVTGAIFDEQKAWVAWAVLGGILLLAALFLGTVRNKGRSTT